MSEIEGVLIAKIQRTPNVFSFRFKFNQTLSFIPGQFLEVVFNRQNRNDRSLNKYLSFSSAPGKESIEITKKISETQFSQRLSSLNMGEKVLFIAPMGNCVFKPEYQNIAFLIGGIGITPVISILEHINIQKINTDVCLLYSNTTEQDIAFKEELDSWSKENKNIKLWYVITNLSSDNKQYLTGVIARQTVEAKISDYQKRIFFIFGPPRMVTAMNNICLEIGCSPELIKTENFIGY